MSSRMLNFRKFLPPVAGFALGVSLMAVPLPGYQDSQTAPDNSRQNKDRTSRTADQQGMQASDRTITQKIRKAIHDDSGLSGYAYNIKIITKDGKVTLRGPVRSEDEKNSLQARAATVVPAENISNELQVAPK